MSRVQSKEMSQYFYRASAADFMKIPGMPIAYWADRATLNAFSENDNLGSHIIAAVGQNTGDNDRFLRYWSEISFARLGIGFSNLQEANSSGFKWFPYNKGGAYRKWYGNIFYVVNWENDGEEVKQYAVHRNRGKHWSRYIQNLSYMLREGVSWSATSSSYFGCRYTEPGFFFDVKGTSAFSESVSPKSLAAFLGSKVASQLLKFLNPTIEFQTRDVKNLPYVTALQSQELEQLAERCISVSKEDWNSYETSWEFVESPLISTPGLSKNLSEVYKTLRSQRFQVSLEMRTLEEENNRIFIEACGLQDTISPDVALEDITLTCNPHYRYGGKLEEEEREARLQSDTFTELVSYTVGCMVGRYSLDKSGLILASQGETLRDYLNQIPEPRFVPDNDAILPFTDQEWFTDDATNRFREFVRVVWGDEHLQENLDFVAESLCLHAIKPKRGESALDTIRRYLSTQFYKDHLRTYKKRPIYWLFSSGKHKAFECLVYLHRYNEGTLARMRTEYVIPLSAKLNAYAEKLEQDKEASTSAAETKRLEKDVATLHKQQAELAEFDEKLRHYADQRISLDLDDGVKVNYGKFGDLLAEVKAVTGEKPQ